MSDLLTIIVIFSIAQLFDYLSMTSYSLNFGYDYKYLPLDIKRQLCLICISLFFIYAVVFADHSNPSMWVTFISMLPMFSYAFFAYSDLVKNKPSDEALDDSSEDN